MKTKNPKHPIARITPKKGLLMNLMILTDPKKRIAGIKAAGVGLALLSLAGCGAFSRPPKQIQEALETMAPYMQEYTAEANRALRQAQHPDATRLIGIGERLNTGLQKLNEWAQEAPEEGSKADEQ